MLRMLGDNPQRIKAAMSLFELAIDSTGASAVGNGNAGSSAVSIITGGFTEVAIVTQAHH